MNTKKSVTDTDKIIGERIKSRRLMLGMTQSDLAKRCGISFQQIQKYETSNGRIPCSRLFQICQALETSMNFFFDTKNNMYNQESMELLILYWKLPEKVRKNLVINLLKHLN